MPTPQIESCIIQLLLDNVDIEVATSARIYPGSRPQTTGVPCIVVNLNDSGEDHDIGETEDHCTPMVEVEIYSDTYYGATAIAEEVRKLKDFSGTVTVYTRTPTITIGPKPVIGTRHIHSIVIEDEASVLSDPQDASDDYTYIRRILLWIHADR